MLIKYAWRIVSRLASRWRWRRRHEDTRGSTEKGNHKMFIKCISSCDSKWIASETCERITEKLQNCAITQQPLLIVQQTLPHKTTFFLLLSLKRDIYIIFFLVKYLLLKQNMRKASAQISAPVISSRLHNLCDDLLSSDAGKKEVKNIFCPLTMTSCEVSSSKSTSCSLVNSNDFFLVVPN